MPRGLLSGLFPSEFCIHFSSSPCMLHALPISSSLIYDPNNIWRRVQIMELFIVQFSRASCHFIPLRSKHSPKYPLLKRRQSVFFLNMRDQVSHSYKTVGKIIVLYILIFMFLDSTWEHRTL
jgi:hypothetical protein